MKSKYLWSRHGGLTFAVLSALVIAAGTTAHAQYPYGRDRYGYGDVYQIAQDQGYRDGVEHGADHARQGRRYDPEGTSHYKDATSGYRSSYGNKDAYKRAYREGFRQGYDEGFNRFGGSSTRSGNRGGYDPYYRNDDPYYRNRNDGHGGYGTDIYGIAQDQGYRDGVDHGADHARQGKRYDPQATSHYKDATSGYRSEYGNKDAYKQAYREGFRRGYDEGYRRYGGGSGRRNSRNRSADILGTIFGRP